MTTDMSKTPKPASPEELEQALAATLLNYPEDQAVREVLVLLKQHFKSIALYKQGGDA